jgi:hypothetical protein
MVRFSKRRVNFTIPVGAVQLPCGWGKIGPSVPYPKEARMKKGTTSTLLAIYLILAGILVIASIPYLNYVAGALAIATGVLMLIKKR